MPGDVEGDTVTTSAAVRARRVQRLLDPAAQRAKDQPQEELGPGIQRCCDTVLRHPDLTPDGPTATLRLVCFLLSADGQEHAYGVDSPLLGYSYYGEVLLDWIVERLANQKGSPDTPFEDVGTLMAASGHPEHVLIGIGATRYTPLGETTFLQPGDEAIVRVYDTDSEAFSELRQMVLG